jgi:dTDP-4-amino-4,6-dideoxygalactose transaminase
MVVTDDNELAKRLRALRNHGMVKVADSIRFEMAGFNYRMTDFQGALGAVQMDRLEVIIERRVELAQVYDEALAGIAGVVRPTAAEYGRHIWQSYVVLLEHTMDRDGVIGAMREAGVETTIGTYAISTQPYYAGRAKDLPNSHRFFQQGLCLPLHTQMTTADVERVAECLARILN